MEEKVIKLRRGKFIEVDIQVIRWQRRMRKFRKYQKLVFETILKWYAGDTDKSALFMRTPHPDLGGQSPRDFLNPKQILKLYKWIKGLEKAANKS